MKRTLNVLLLLRFPTTNGVELVSALERAIDCVDAAGDLSIHWSYPIHPLLGDSSSRADRVVERLKERPNDRTLPIGFTGAYHPLLQVDELRKELEWSSTNPWNEDLKTAFGSERVAALFPFSLDLWRERSRSVYSEASRLLAVDPRTGELVTVDDESFTSIPLLMPARFDHRRLGKKLLRFYRRDAYDSVGIIVDGLEVRPEELAAIFELVDELRERRSGFAVRLIDELPDAASAPSGDLPSLALRVVEVPNDPVSRANRLHGPEKAKGRKRGADELIRRRLEGLAPVEPSGEHSVRDRASGPRVDDRTLVADMSGIVNLSESQLTARFDGGRLAGMAHGQTKVVVEKPIRSYLQFAGSGREFATVSSFSFEGEHCRGLRTILALDGDGIGQPGQIVEDYYFEDGKSDLLVTVTVTYPEITGADIVEEYAVLELPLFSLGADEVIEAECEYPDGERYTARINAQPHPFQLAGRRFCFRAGSGEFRLAFPDLPNAIPEVVGARFRRDGDGYTLCVNPRGSYSSSPAAAFTAVAEQFHLAVSVAASRPQGSPAAVGNALPTSARK